MRSYGVIHMVVRRDARTPSEVLWYVRRVWLRNGHTHDRVVAQGRFSDVPGSRHADDVVRDALRAALAQLDGELGQDGGS